MDLILLMGVLICLTLIFQTAYHLLVLVLFFACNNINNIVIPDGVTAIEEDTFRQCFNLVNITIPSSITSIGARAFAGCWSLEEIIFPGLVTSIGTEAFYGCNMDITFYSNTPAVIVSDTFNNFSR